MKINNRLKNVANFVLKDSNVIDVGCDHALLCIYLASNYPNMRLIASDVREGPLKQAKANIEKYGLEDRITLKLGDGIATIDNDTNVIVISGMGGITIADIITKNKENVYIFFIIYLICFSFTLFVSIETLCTRPKTVIKHIA